MSDEVFFQTVRRIVLLYSGYIQKFYNGELTYVGTISHCGLPLHKEIRGASTQTPLTNIGTRSNSLPTPLKYWIKKMQPRPYYVKRHLEQPGITTLATLPRLTKDTIYSTVSEW
jgi:hypothetical protein